MQANILLHAVACCSKKMRANNLLSSYEIILLQGAKCGILHRWVAMTACWAMLGTLGGKQTSMTEAKKQPQPFFHLLHHAGAP
jgi:hypothetical protein